jgi:hypothetical protein
MRHSASAGELDERDFHDRAILPVVQAILISLANRDPQCGGNGRAGVGIIAADRYEFAAEREVRWMRMSG